VTCFEASARIVEPVNETFPPLPIVGLPFTSSGGQALAQAPVLAVPVSFLKR
jgi:hypothetical protein